MFVFIVNKTRRCPRPPYPLIRLVWVLGEPEKSSSTSMTDSGASVSDEVSDILSSGVSIKSIDCGSITEMKAVGRLALSSIKKPKIGFGQREEL